MLRSSFVVGLIVLLGLPAHAEDVPGFTYAPAPALHSWSDQRLERADGETDLEFIRRLTVTVHEATYFCDYQNPPNVPADFKLGEYGLLAIEAFECGYCHQRAFILARALRNGGVADATPYGLSGHVVTLIRLGAATYIADADYGVGPFVLPADPETIRAVIAAEYAAPRRIRQDTVLPQVEEFYATPDDNSFYSYETLIEISDAQAAELRRSLLPAP